MKLLFAVLLVLSIGFFAFMQWGGALTGAAKNGQAMADLNPDKIKLLLAPAAKQLLPASAVVQALPVLPASAPLAASAAVVASPAPAAVALPASAPAAAVSAPVMVALPVHASVPAAVSAAAPVAKVAANSCMEWGEFSGTDLKQATQELAGMKLGNRLSQRVVEYDSGYWVYISPLKGQAAVKRKIEQLRELGVVDHFVVPMPGHKVSAISLGVFKTREAAENFLASLKKKGVRTAKVGERKSKLKFTVFTLKHVDAEAVLHLTKLQKEFANSELKQVSCK